MDRRAGLLSSAGSWVVRRSFQLAALETKQVAVVLNSTRDYSGGLLKYLLDRDPT